MLLQMPESVVSQVQTSCTSSRMLSRNNTLRNEPVSQNVCSFASLWQVLILCNQLVPITMKKAILNVECIQRDQCCGDQITDPSLGSPIKPRELRQIDCTCAPHLSRRGGATLGSYKGQQGGHLLDLGCFLRRGDV